MSTLEICQRCFRPVAACRAHGCDVQPLALALDAARLANKYGGHPRSYYQAIQNAQSAPPETPTALLHQLAAAVPQREPAGRAAPQGSQAAALVAEFQAATAQAIGQHAPALIVVQLLRQIVEAGEGVDVDDQTSRSELRTLIRALKKELYERDIDVPRQYRNYRHWQLYPYRGAL